jgi:DNA-directed RNA polymerase subunit beta
MFSNKIFNALDKDKILKEKRTYFRSNKKKLQKVDYFLQKYQRSNQDTSLVQRPAVSEGDWLEVGDLLADCSTSSAGELSLGKNILMAYIPWEGYNYEDAILISERLVHDDVYTSVHIEKYEIQTQQTKYGPEEITKKIPDLSYQEIFHLDKEGIAHLGSSIQEGKILVGKITPTSKKFESPYQKLIYTVLKKELHPFRDTSLRGPKNLNAKVVHIQIVRKKTKSVSHRRIDNKPLYSSSPWRSRLLLGKAGTPYGVGRRPRAKGKALLAITSSPGPLAFAEKRFTRGKEEGKDKNLKGKRKSHYSLENVQLYLAEKRNLQVGDKMAGRHGNKGIVSQILPREDMPYLPDGRPLDMVLNPLGVPSRMNVGQIYECLLGLAAQQLGVSFKVPPFDEIYGAEASRSLTYRNLYKAATLTGKSWLFHSSYPGKMRIFDGRTGECFDQAVTVGVAYMLKLVHLVEDKIHARSTGPYSLVNQQPLKGRSKEGGQRLGEMEVWALQGYGAAFTLLEMLTLKSDDMTGRINLWLNLIRQNEMKIGTPESFKVLVCELQALCLDIGLYRLDSRNLLRKVENLAKLP